MGACAVDAAGGAYSMGALTKLLLIPVAADTMLRDVDPTRTGKISFEQFMTMLAQREDGAAARCRCARGTCTEVRRAGAAEEGGDEGADPKVLEFLRILDEYRQKCEEEGNYMEAERATRQLETLRKQVRARQPAHMHLP